MCKCTPFEKTRFVTSSGAENHLTVCDTFIRSKISNVNSSKFTTETNLFYELQAWCLKISVGGPLCYKIQAKMAEIRLPGVNHLLWIGMLAELTCGERVCLKLVDVLLLLFKSGQPQWFVMKAERFLPPQIIYWNLLLLFLYLLWSRQFLMPQKCSSSKQEAVLSCCHGTWNAKMA